MPKAKRSRRPNKAICICALLAVVVIWTAGLLIVQLRPYWVAKYHGKGVDLRRAVLVRAPLPHANLSGSRLGRADLRGADLRDADLCGADLRGANLRGADLRAAYLVWASFKGADLRGADLRNADFWAGQGCGNIDVVLKGARYDKHTRWPVGLQPKWDGAVLVR